MEEGNREIKKSTWILLPSDRESREGGKLITADDACRRVITFYWRAPG